MAPETGKAGEKRQAGVRKGVCQLLLTYTQEGRVPDGKDEEGTCDRKPLLLARMEWKRVLHVLAFSLFLSSLQQPAGELHTHTTDPEDHAFSLVRIASMGPRWSSR